MSEPLSIVDLVTHVGAENIKVQNVMHNATDYKNGKKLATITFATDPATVADLMHASVFGGHAKTVGLVIWFPADKLPQ